MSQETIRAAERAAGQVNTMSTYDPDSDQLHEECGIFGVWAPDRDVARLTYFGLRALQHRGQESAGIAVGDGGTVMVRKDLGLLDRVFSNADLSTLSGQLAVGHVRYGTAGAKSWEASQPHLSTINSVIIALAHNGTLVNTDELRRQRRFTHVIEPFDLAAPACRGWTVFRSYDFGYGRPFSCAWWAVDYDGRLYRILEYYGCTAQPNQGLRLSPDEQFREIARMEREHPWLRGRSIDGVADPSIWDASRGESVAETAARYGLYFLPGDNHRVAGWMQCHYRLQFDEEGLPGMYVFEGCAAFLRTVPLLRFSAVRPEDVDTEQEDHAADEWRYACMSRPIAPRIELPAPARVWNPLG